MKNGRRNIFIGAVTAAAAGAAAWHLLKKRRMRGGRDDLVGTMRVSSPAFVSGGQIPSEYTCDGKNVNPPLVFENVPFEARSLVLIMDDPDVPKEIRPSGVFDHWVVFNIPPDTTGVASDSVLPGTNGMNGGGSHTYTGPCPPGGEHRYFFKLYALDDMLDLPQGASKQQVEEAMVGHVLCEAEFVGRYGRP